ncbi:ArgE/DapE family deacylase [Streptomyces sp. NPDC094154]|uniref:ArgE/DapE family deacylase n=1 Tax=Streptomyces sp. NPDC094154 TaxID=3366059 RepID=UPI003800CB6F
MLTEDQRQAVLDAVDAAFDRQVQFTSRLVSEPSLRGQETSAQGLLEQAMRDRGLQVERWALDPEELATHPGAGAVVVPYERTENVVGTYTPATAGGRSLILNGHVDVVPTGVEDFWSRSPWQADVVDGWLYGRGAGDMKAGLVANLFAFDAVLASGLRPTATIHFQSVPEEESTGNGTLSALQRGYTADAVLISEPTQGALVRAHLGVIWFSVRVAGQAAHAAEMANGSNAVDAAYAVIADLRTLEAEWNQRATGHPYLSELEHPLNFNIGIIQGGDWPSSVPDWCEFSVRASFPPGTSVEDAWREITERVERSARNNPALAGMQPTTRRTGFFADGYVLEKGSEAEATLAGVHKAATGRDLETTTVTGYIDSRVYGLFAGIPAMVFGPVAEKLHGADERVSLHSLREVTKSIALFIAEWCGAEAAGH